MTFVPSAFITKTDGERWSRLDTKAIRPVLGASTWGEEGTAVVGDVADGSVVAASVLAGVSPWLPPSGEHAATITTRHNIEKQAPTLHLSRKSVAFLVSTDRRRMPAPEPSVNSAERSLFVSRGFFVRPSGRVEVGP